VLAVSDDQHARFLRDAAAVEPLGPGRYGVTLSPYFSVVGRPNGGYLQCVMASAAIAAAAEAGSTHQHATAITTNYVGSPLSGRAEIEAQVRRVGRGASFVHVALREEGELTTESLVTLGTLREDSHLRYLDAPLFELPSREECVRSHGGQEEINIGKSVEMRLDPQCVRWWAGEVSERAEVRGWLRLDDGSAAPWDAWSLLFASDAMPPATFPIGSTGWVPTLQLSSYVRSVPTSEWLRVRQWCVVVEDGLADERCEIFDDRGRLVASSSQLAMCRFPKAD
jgi:acyl-coenzyme A thioesterase PaaI-like protein